MLNLAELLRSAREARDIPQQVVADALGLPRTAITNIENGNRAVSTLELTRMADLYGRSAAYFLGETNEEAEQDIFVRLLNDLPVVAKQQEFDENVKRLIGLFEVGTSLKTLLNQNVNQAMPDYAPIMGKIRNSGNAAYQGQQIAQMERQRLGLGNRPATSISAIVASQGLWCAATPLPSGVSGMFITHSTIGSAILVDSTHIHTRRRFSYAHEYAHALLDHEAKISATMTVNANQLIEQRANAFAANFLMPAQGVAEQLDQMAKGLPSRSTEFIFDEFDNPLIEASRRPRPGSQAIAYQDAASLARHFVVSYDAAVWRLKNLGYVTRPQSQKLLQQRESANRFINTLENGNGTEHISNPPPPERELRHQLIRLTLEAYRQGEISKGRILEICGKLGVDAATIIKLADATLGV